MAAFSNYHHQQYYPHHAAAPFVLDSFLEQGITTITAADHEGTSFSSFFSNPDHETYLHDQEIIPLHADHHQIHESTCAAITTTATTTHDDPSLSFKEEYHPPTSSTMVVNQLGSSSGNTHDPVEIKKRKNKDYSMVERESRSDGGKCSTGTIFVRNHGDQEMRRKRFAKKQKKVSVEIPNGCVHVRARRGQATDSHSLAERVRRQKISVRMKILQSLVPGCDKMTGKALILDEIIQYVKTLQSQVQFLAAKFASINPMLDDFEIMDFNTNPVLAQELPPVLDTSSTQLLHQEQSSNMAFQDNCNLLWGTDDGQKRQEHVNDQYGLQNLYSF
ncbi:hypothetical protein ACOSQ2_019134 [Xanthoceras sorbifolium]